MLKPTHIAETSLYVDDLERAVRFYTQLFEAERVHRDERLCALRVSSDQVLLLFKRGSSLTPTTLPGGTVPAHDGAGPLHVCFGIRAEELAAWEERLTSAGIETRKPGALAGWGIQPLLPRPGQPCRGTRHAGTMDVMCVGFEQRNGRSATRSAV